MADTSNVLHQSEQKFSNEIAVQDASDEEKARFLELRDALAGWQWVVFHLIIFFGAAISGYDVSNVSTTQISIYKEFGHVNLLPWVVTAFSLGNAATSPILNQIMKLVDLKGFILGCWTIFLVASAVVGASPTITGVIVGRTILGVATGGIYLALLTYTNILAKPTEHSRLTGILGMGFAVGLIFGPIVGGAFAENEHATWRWAFYICIPYTAVMMLFTFLACPRVRIHPQEKISHGLFKIDWAGAFLHITTLVVFDAACIFSGSTLPWKSAGVITLWTLSGLAAAAYTVQQWFSLFTEPSRRILPIAVLSDRTGFLVTLCTALSTCGHGIALYYLPLYYAFTKGDGSLDTAVHLLPYICLYVAGAIGAGILLPIMRRYLPIYLLGGLLMVAGSGSMLSINKNTQIGQTMGISAMLGFGIGSTTQLGASVLALGLPADIRMDSSITMTMTVYTGIGVALALAGCIFQNIGYDFLSHALRGSDLSSVQIHQALAGVHSPIWARLSPRMLEAAIEAVTSAIIRLFYISLAAGALMVICSLMMKWEALDFKRYAKSEDGEMKMEEESQRV